MSFTIGFTGTRKGITEFQGEMLEQMLTGFIDSVRQPINVIHGGAEGADRSFHRIICTGGGYGLAEGDSFDVEQVDIIPSTVPDTDGSSSYDMWELAVFLGMRDVECILHDAKPPLVRNKDIVNASDVMLCCPSGEEVRRSGTWATIRYAKTALSCDSVIIIYPCGGIYQGGAEATEGAEIIERAVLA